MVDVSEIAFEFMVVIEGGPRERRIFEKRIR
jgi:hypothetical protein